MITVTIYKKSNQYLGFDINGHAGYAEEGSDIICAAVSVLSLNTLNSIEAFTEDEFSGEQVADLYVPGAFIRESRTFDGFHGTWADRHSKKLWETIYQDCIQGGVIPCYR